MADAVADAVRQRRHLVVEAGTGVGKSFAYLVPVILAATNELNGFVPTGRTAVNSAEANRARMPTIPPIANGPCRAS